MKDHRNFKSISRRRFISTLMMATAAGSLLSSCKSSSWQIGCYTRAWGSRNYLVSLDGMAEAGFKYVGLSTHDKGRVIDYNSTPEESAIVGEEIRKRGLTLVTNSGGSFDAAKPVDEGIVQLRRLIDNSAACGAPVIQINDMSKPDLVDTFYKVIAECCDYAFEKGVMITLKPHGSTGAQCRVFVDKVAHKNFKLWYDPGNVCYYTEGKVNPVDDADSLDGVVVGMAVKDFRMPKDVNITPGTGMVDFPALISRLNKGGFNGGPLIIECLDPGEIPSINAEAQKAKVYIENIISQI